MSSDEIVFDEHLLKVSKWQHFRLWLHRRKNYKRITIWVRKEDDGKEENKKTENTKLQRL